MKIELSTRENLKDILNIINEAETLYERKWNQSME